jgi:hypothetical protein
MLPLDFKFQLQLRSTRSLVGFNDTRQPSSLSATPNYACSIIGLNCKDNADSERIPMFSFPFPMGGIVMLF